MRYLRLTTAWTLGVLIMILALIFGGPLCILSWLLNVIGDASEYGNVRVRRTQKFIGSKMFYPALEFCRRIHPDGGDKYV